MSGLSGLKSALTPEAGTAKLVPPAGFSVTLTLLTAGIMAFLAVLALALSSAVGRTADRWGEDLARASTIRISAPAGEMSAQTAAVLRVLETTPGVASARAMTTEEQAALLAPWFGPDLPVSQLPVPQLVEIAETPEGYDAAGLRLRLAAEAPGAVLDDHERWRRPLTEAARGLRSLGLVAVLLIAGATAAMVTLAAHAALAANAQVIGVLRLVGATDAYIAGAFVRRFTARAFAGALAGTAIGLWAVMLLPDDSLTGGVGFSGAGWLWPAVIPVTAAILALLATHLAARRVLERLS